MTFLLNPFAHGAGVGGGGGAVATLTVAASTVAATLTDFVVRVKLNDLPSGWWASGDTDGSDVRVKQGGSVIPFDLVYYDGAAMIGELYFKHTLTTSDNVFTIEQVGGSSALAATDPNGRNAVWSDYDAFVCGVPSATTFINRVTGTVLSVIDTTPTGHGDGFINFGTSSNGQIYLSGLPQRSVYTLGVSTLSQETGSDNRAHLSYTTENNGALGARVTLVDEGGDTRAVWNSTNGWRRFGERVLDVIERRVATFDGSTQMLIYLDGSLVLTDDAVAVRPPGSPCDLILGARNRGTSERWHGRLNRAYLRDGVLSADWLAAEYESWESPSSFYAIT